MYSLIKTLTNLASLTRLLSLLILLAFINPLYGDQSPFADDDEDSSSIFADDDEEMSNTNKMIFLDAVQKRFWDSTRKPTANITNIAFVAGETYSIRTRANMTTTFIFDNDKIALAMLGDASGFELKEIDGDKYDLSNVITIKPNLVGIDTNLTIIGESGNVYSFYIFSTNYKNNHDPAFVVFVSEFRKIGKINVENKEAKENEEILKKFELINSENGTISANVNQDEFIERESDTQISIGDRVNRISINKAEIRRGYKQMPRKDIIGQISPDAEKLMAKEIFNDNKWTYFKFDRNLATSKFPAIFRVIDGYDNPMNSRVVGNYLIVETINDKWTLRIGDEYVCVQKDANEE